MNSTHDTRCVPAPRSARVEYAGAVYHVMCRWDRREPIFKSDEDRRLTLSTLEEMCERTGMWVHSYVLMTNHYHLLIEISEPNLVVGINGASSAEAVGEFGFG